MIIGRLVIIVLMLLMLLLVEPAACDTTRSPSSIGIRRRFQLGLDFCRLLLLLLLVLVELRRRV